MHYLIFVSLMWAFSFGLIKGSLSGIDPFFAATVRLGLACLVFIPFLRPRIVPSAECLKLIGCGAAQFGIMYISYMKAYAYLPAHLVALFSILTPVYVLIIHDARKRRSVQAKALLAVGLSVAGAAIIKAQSGQSETLFTGFALMQLAGVSFAFGQVYYRDWKRKYTKVADHSIFAFLYIGGFSFAFIASVFLADPEKVHPTMNQWLTLLYLGIVASGIGFFLWNKGAALSKATTLAVCNNAVVPLAIVISMFVFGEIDQATKESLTRLFLGGFLILSSLIVAERIQRNELS